MKRRGLGNHQAPNREDHPKSDKNDEHYRWRAGQIQPLHQPNQRCKYKAHQHRERDRQKNFAPEVEARDNKSDDRKVGSGDTETILPC